MFSFLSNCQTIFQSGCTILHSHQQHARDLVSLNICQHLIWLLMFILAILTFYSSKTIFYFPFSIHVVKRYYIFFHGDPTLFCSWNFDYAVLPNNSHFPICTCSNILKPWSLIQRPHVTKKVIACLPGRNYVSLLDSSSVLLLWHFVLYVLLSHFFSDTNIIFPTRLPDSLQQNNLFYLFLLSLLSTPRVFKLSINTSQHDSYKFMLI